MPEPADHDGVFDDAVRLLEGLRAFGAHYAEYTGQFASWLGLHSTDAVALAEILYAEDQGAPLSPSRLSRRLSLTTGATTNLLNRLERLGHIVRSRESTDRRTVTLRSSKSIEEPAREFFAVLSQRFGTLIAQYPPEQREQFAELLDQLRDMMSNLVAAEPPPPYRAGSATGLGAG